jgi:hypothetical protein
MTLLFLQRLIFLAKKSDNIFSVNLELERGKLDVKNFID